MSAVASLTFDFDGSETEFTRLYDALADLDLEIGAFAEGTTGVIEFMIGDFAVFEEHVARRSAELGIALKAHENLVSAPQSLTRRCS